MKAKLDWNQLATHRCPGCGAGLKRLQHGMECRGGTDSTGATCTFFIRKDRYVQIRKDLGYKDNPFALSDPLPKATDWP